METQQPTGIEYYPITYTSWNSLTIGSFFIVVVSIIICIFTVTLTVCNDYYKQLRVCHPIFFYMGDKGSCKNFIIEKVKEAIKQSNRYQPKLTNKQIIKNILEKDTFQNLNSSDDFTIEPPNTWRSLSSDFNKFKETANNNYLAMVDFIHSLIELIWRVIFNELRKITHI
jgi:hypothetical protein